MNQVVTELEAIYSNYLKPVFDKLVSESTKINSEKKVAQNEKRNFFNLLSALTKTHANNKPVDLILSQMQIRKDNFKVSRATIQNARDLFKYFPIRRLNTKLIDVIFKNAKPRQKIVDGSIIYLPIAFRKWEYAYSNNGHCCIALLSAVYDAETKIPLSYHIHKTKSEREAFLKQLKFINKGDIVTFDRGYYSEHLFSLLHERGIKVIFRMKDDVSIVQKLIDSGKNDILINYDIGKKNVRARLIKYDIANIEALLIKKQFNYEEYDDEREVKPDDYYLLTNIVDKYTVDDFMDFYHNRWRIETHFKLIKYNLSLKRVTARQHNSFLQDIYIHQLICILGCLIEYHLNEHLHKQKPDYKINSHNCIYLTATEILDLCFHKYKESDTAEKIVMIMSIISKKIVQVKPFRQFPRMIRSPANKWSNAGSTSDRRNIKKKVIKSKCIKKRQRKRHKKSNNRRRSPIIIINYEATDYKKFKDNG
jgi:hypothetical protein